MCKLASFRFLLSDFVLQSHAVIGVAFPFPQFRMHLLLEAMVEKRSMVFITKFIACVADDVEVVFVDKLLEDLPDSIESSSIICILRERIKILVEQATRRLSVPTI